MARIKKDQEGEKIFDDDEIFESVYDENQHKDKQHDKHQENQSTDLSSHRKFSKFKQDKTEEAHHGHK